MKNRKGYSNRSLLLLLVISIVASLVTSCGKKKTGGPDLASGSEMEAPEGFQPVYSLLVIPKNPHPGEKFRIVATGGRNIRKGYILVAGKSQTIESNISATSGGWPFWRMDELDGMAEGKYTATLKEGKEEVCRFEFFVSGVNTKASASGIWKNESGWDARSEALFSAWINCLFQGSDERSSWPALHAVTQNPEHNFLYNYLSLDEDNPDGKIRVIMEPDCADNPFYLRAYFSWKLGLPFGYHVSDRGSLNRCPGTGQWITNTTNTSKAHPVLAFNSFLRRVMDGVHSGTARTAFTNENSDYYPIALEKRYLPPGTVFADPYGHTLTLVNWVPQSKNIPGVLLAVDAQPDGTIAIKRFWRGNFLFNTVDVVGEPGFKAFRPIVMKEGIPILLKNTGLTDQSGFPPFSLQQNKMERDAFYHSMEQLINPRPLDPEDALLDLIKALHEQLLVRVNSVANGEKYMNAHPGTVIPMPSTSAGIFQTGGVWEDYSTPNRDMRLLIAIDAVIDFPEKVMRSPEDYSLSKLTSPEQVKKKLMSVLEKKTSELTISYTRSDGSAQNLTVAEILSRRDAFEMGYNPNDCPEIRWGAPENSSERGSCKRQSPAAQVEKMKSFRKWFTQRLHPPT